jgi:hypothetical protein
MDLFHGPWSLILAFSIFLFGLVICLPLSVYFKVNSTNTIFIYIWHTIFCFVYFFFVSRFGGDAIGYWISYEWVESFQFGTYAVVWLVRFLKLSGMSIVGGFLTFNIIGTIGLIAFYASLRSAVRYSSEKLQKITLIIVFLPSISFWTSGIGKDSIACLAVGLALWSALRINSRMLLMFLSILLMLYVRPHMAGMLVIALALSMVLQKNIPLLGRLFMGVVGFIGIAILVPFALNYAGVNDNGNIVQYVEQRQMSNLNGGSSLDISSMPLPVKMFTYLVRPLIFEARSIPQIAASIDNIFLLFLLLIGGREILRTRFNNLAGNRVMLWIYVLLAWIILSMTTANLGIAMRQKWMFVPILIYLLISILAEKESRSLK